MSVEEKIEQLNLNGPDKNDSVVTKKEDAQTEVKKAPFLFKDLRESIRNRVSATSPYVPSNVLRSMLDSSSETLVAPRLHRCYGAVLVCNLNSLPVLATAVNAEELAPALSKITSSVVEMINGLGGDVISMDRGLIIAVWNRAEYGQNTALRAVDAADKVRSCLDEQLYDFSDEIGDALGQFRVSVALGEVFLYHVGEHGHRFHIVPSGRGVFEAKNLVMNV